MTDKPRDPLADSLNIDSELEVFAPPATIDRPERISDAVDEDYEFARATVIDTITKATEALDQQISLAQQSQLPRAYEVVATLVKAIVDSNKDLLELSKRAKDLKGAEADEGPRTINNTLVVTTDQLQKLLQDQGVVTTTRQMKKEDPENGQ